MKRGSTFSPGVTSLAYTSRDGDQDWVSQKDLQFQSVLGIKMLVGRSGGCGIPGLQGQFQGDPIFPGLVAETVHVLPDHWGNLCPLCLGQFSVVTPPCSWVMPDREWEEA